MVGTPRRKLFLRLQRTAYNKDHVRGILDVNACPPWVTMEPPWAENQCNISCIPPGEYQCAKYLSKKFGRVLVVLNVPGRTGILFHKGNYPKDTEGCILIGDFYSKEGVLGASANGMKRLLLSIEYFDNIVLRIT